MILNLNKNQLKKLNNMANKIPGYRKRRVVGFRKKHNAGFKKTKRGFH